MAQTVTDIQNLPRQILIRCRFADPTNTRGSRWIATYKRSREETFRAEIGFSHEVDDRGEHAAYLCLQKINANRREILPDGEDWIITAAAHDDDGYYYLATYPLGDGK